MISLVHSRPSFFDLRTKDKVMVGDMPYIVERAVRGGMGFVLLLRLDSANAPQRTNVLGLKLALKGVLRDAANTEGVALFKRELTVWSAFRHFHIVWLLEIVDGGDAGWLAAMDWCIGSLRDLINEQKSMSLRDSTNIIVQLIKGLAYAYEKDGVLHLDLKPENVLYHLDLNRLIEGDVPSDPLSKYRFMVSDWGIASIKQPQLNLIVGKSPTSEAARRTFNNMGTISYMAPERLKEGFSSSIASDVFSLGMIYLEMLVGRLPFRAGVHPVESLVTAEYLADARHLLSSAKIAKPVSSLIQSMIAFSPSERPRDHLVLLEALGRSFKKANSFLTRLFS